VPEVWLAGIFGLLIGSFLNVCIYRWPRDLSVVRPRSKCPACDAGIAWYDNVPVLSWLLLRGRCRHCRARIHWRYPVVELLTAVSFAWFVSQHGLSLAAARYCVFTAILIALGFADADTRILPDELTLGGTLIGFVLSASLTDSLIGAVVASGSLWLAGWLFKKLRHKEGLGLGDVKMLAMIGAFLGLQGALLTIVVGSFLGAIVGLVWIRLTGKDAASYELPFGTFLAVAGFLVAVGGESVIGWYTRNFFQ
jgi:leader peptidase (prepilin peptidase)/N-methyltransferase